MPSPKSSLGCCQPRDAFSRLARARSDLGTRGKERHSSAMLPTVSKGRASSSVRPSPVFAHYLRRIVKD
ncbi:hypothetical protein M5K25_016032 [Dendrobium thyrsiflorum]|uniref:Uncharacterized protein n=1 Tax=Dendrobium thyrsiflorum TaxID=117978 RepID=A0ABD0URW0_DENTH